MTISKPTVGATGWNAATDAVIDAINAINAAAGPTPSGGDDATAVQTWLTALGNAGGGFWDLAGRTYILRAAVTVPPKVHLYDGALYFDTDLGSGVVGVTLDNGGNTSDAPRLSKITITGPSVAMAYGTVGNAMDGLKTCSSTTLTECVIQNFRANVLVFTNHERFIACRFTSGYYNVYYGPGAATFGDQSFLDCDLTGARWASVGVAPGNMLDSVFFMAGHFGFAPYGIYKETGTATQSFIHDSKILGTSFEAIGNGAILDDSSNSTSISSLAHTVIDQPGFSWDATRKITARGKDYAVSVGNALDTRVIPGAYPFTAGDVGAVNVAGGVSAALPSGLADPWQGPGAGAWLDETFPGSNGSAWPTGWSGFGTADQQNNDGRAIAGTGSYDSYGNYRSVPVDAELLVRWRWSNAGSDRIADFSLRDTGSGTYYQVRVTATDVILRKSVSGVGAAQLDGYGQTQAVGVWYWTRFRIRGTKMLGRTWADGATEPATWQVSGTDTAITAAGSVGLAGEGTKTGGTPVTALYDRVQVFDL